MTETLGVPIDAEAINKYVADRILESAIGEALKQQIDKAVGDLGQSYKNPFEHLIGQHIRDEVSRLIREEYAEQIREVVRARVTEQFTNDLIAKAFEAFERQAYA